MNFISTKQAAELWGISPRRVALLASQGRIEGAVSMGNTWLIPEDARKPEDNRRRAAKAGGEPGEKDVFPYLICIVNSPERIERFTADEKRLYDGFMLHEAGRLNEARQCAEPLVSSPEASVRLGALYLLAFNSLYRFDYEGAERFTLLFYAEYHSTGECSVAHTLLFAAFEAEMGRASSFAKAAELVTLHTVDRELLPVIAAQKLGAEMYKYGMSRKKPDVSVYELLCLITEADGYMMDALFIHSYLSLFYAVSGDSEGEMRHTRRVVDIALESDCFFSVTCALSMGPNSLESILNEYPPEVRERFLKTAEIYRKARAGYAEYQSGHAIFSTLKEDDYKLILCCTRGCSTDKMAQLFGLSRSGINRRLTNLYAKLGVSSRKELTAIYIDSVCEWGKNR